MLQFIKGQGTALYFELIQKNSSYRESLYLDTVAKRLYFDGQATDIRISVITEIDDDYKARLSYKFTNADGETTVVKDTVIPELSDYVMTLHDMESGEDNEYSNGLYAVKDKFLIEAMTKLMGITLQYTYYANVNHIRDHKWREFDKMTDVIVYKTDDEQWLYDYESFDYPVYVQLEDGSYVIDGYRTLEPGSAVVSEDVVRLQSIKVIRKAGIQSQFDGGDLPDTQKTITKHGGIPAGTTVAELEEKTVSEVLSEVLFEKSIPVKVCDTSVHVKFTDDYVQSGYIEVGATYPSIDDLSVEFIPETWETALDGSVIGEQQKISEVVQTKYYIKDDQHPWEGGHGPAPDNIYDMEDSGYAEHYTEYKISENDKSTYFVKVTYKVTKYPVDTADSSTYINEDEEVVPYRNGEDIVAVGDSSVITSNYLHMDGTTAEFNVLAGWKVASNAQVLTDENIWSTKNDEPESAFIGSDNFTISDYFAYDGQVLYAKWGSDYTDDDKFYVYLPDGYTISSIGGAHDALENNFTAVSSATEVEGGSIQITNTYYVSKTYNKFEIEKAFGITTVKFTISKVEG